MNFKEAKQKLADHEIYQLNKGESLADAISHIEEGTPRKGYKFKHSDGRLMTDNEIISNENREAFLKSFTPSEFNAEEVDEINDITDSYDFRENKEERGNILNCFYCGDCIRVDGSNDPDDDYDSPENTDHCDDCMNDAIRNLAM